VAEGARVLLSDTAPDRAASPASAPHCPPDVCVATVLRDALRRVSVLGGRDDMPRSLGSMYSGSVTLFLGGALRGVLEAWLVDKERDGSSFCGLGVTPDGSKLLLSSDDTGVGSPSASSSIVVHELPVSDADRSSESLQRRVAVGCAGSLCVASDGFVFVAHADYHTDRIHMLTPELTPHGSIGEGELRRPLAVCANADVVVVARRVRPFLSSIHQWGGIVVLDRRSDTVRVRFGPYGTGDGELLRPVALCFTKDDRRVAVADSTNYRVSVFTVEGKFIRHVGAGVFDVTGPLGVASSPCDELVVGDVHVLRVFSDVGELLKTIRCGHDFVYGDLVLRDSKVFALCQCHYFHSGDCHRGCAVLS
jgi:hypothetical protein